MKDNRIEKIKQHYTIILNNKSYKVLKHKIDSEKSLLTIKTKVFGQNFPHGENISFATAEDSGHVHLPSSPRDKSTHRLKTMDRFRKNLRYGSIL